MNPFFSAETGGSVIAGIVSKLATAVGSVAVVAGAANFVFSATDPVWAYESVIVTSGSASGTVVYGKVTSKSAAGIGRATITFSYTKSGKSKTAAKAVTNKQGNYSAKIKVPCAKFKVKITIPKSAGKSPTNTMSVRMCPGLAYQVSAQLSPAKKSKFLFLPVTSY